MLTMIPNIHVLIKRLNTEIYQRLMKNFAKPRFLIFFQLLNSDFELYSYEKVASAFHTTPNNTSFVQNIKLISAISMALITTINSNYHEPSYVFCDFKLSVKQQIATLVAQARPHLNF